MTFKMYVSWDKIVNTVLDHCGCFVCKRNMNAPCRTLLELEPYKVRAEEEKSPTHNLPITIHFKGSPK